MGGGGVMGVDDPCVYAQNLHRQARSQTRERQRQLSVIQLPSASSLMAKTSIHAMLFLRTRPMDDRHATLVVALSNGSIQMYTHHPLAVPPFKASFNAIHMAGDAVTAMTTDPAERYLIVGTSLGYIKTWLICNYWCDLRWLVVLVECWFDVFFTVFRLPNKYTSICPH